MDTESPISPTSLSMLSRVLQTHCFNHGIRTEEARESVATSLLKLFQMGVHTEEQLLGLLAEEDEPLKRLSMVAGMY